MIERYKQCLASIQHFKNLAREYGKLHLSMDDTHKAAGIYSSCLREEYVEVTWRRTGRYGFEELGEFVVPVEVLCNKDCWADYIQAEVDAQRLKERQRSEIKNAEQKRRAVEAAKKLLQDEGIIGLG
jgi:hypothetical protein